jgi:hypothetical protein
MGDAMRWPGIRRKVWPITVLRCPGWAFWISGPSEHHGCWRAVSIGPWLVLFGSGTYGDA